MEQLIREAHNRNSKMVAIVTGGNGAIGFEVSKALARAGYHVIIASHPPGVSSKTAQSLRSVTGNQNIEGMDLNLMNMDSIRQFVADFQSKLLGLHVLINNAAIMNVEFTRDVRGIEAQFATNYLGPFYLTNLLLHNLRVSAPARVVNVLSSVHYAGGKFYIMLLLVSTLLLLTSTQCSRSQSSIKLWGAATSAAQVEGAWNTSGRSPSIWDTYARLPNKIADNATPSVAADQYHHYQEDIAIMKKLGMSAYRFSISWSRILPYAAPNEEGIQYYDSLINALSSNGIEPVVTLYHWDIPQHLQDAYGGWSSSRVVADYLAFAKLAFTRFADRVTHWITFNEPSLFCELGYGIGMHAPGITGRMYECAHNALRAMRPAGRIGITLNSEFGVPSDIRGRSDYVGLNFYTATYVKAGQSGEPVPVDEDAHGTPIGPVAGSPWLRVVPWAFRRQLAWLNDKYPGIEIMVTENGVDVPREEAMGIIHDVFRVKYYEAYLKSLDKAVRIDGVRVTAYFAWSLLDNFEWLDGFTKRFESERIDEREL
ncbi:hypothetical protein SeMB42_g00665 [Synchytrium endobioticum]|uniref:Beta-glucosidase n=1 Tax=Synchytrium endobioticum TaxID=286115 RepID=A0A507DQ75_9FUNG|nr:hypothetical protein SeMB42_g00665 [Synchytrium endobioticum]